MAFLRQNSRERAAHELISLASPVMPSSSSTNELEQPAGIPRPNEVPPYNCIWDSVHGCWVQKVDKSLKKKKKKEPLITFNPINTSIVTANAVTANGPPYPCPHPRRHGHTWNHDTGKWIKKKENVNTTTASKSSYPCPWPRKSGHTWNHDTGKWIKIANKKPPTKVIQKKSSLTFTDIAERTRTNTRNTDNITENNYNNAIQKSSWNPKWGKPPPHNSLVSASSNPEHSAIQNTTSIKDEPLYKLSKDNVKLLLPDTVLAKYNGENGNWLSRARIKQIVVEWDDGDTEHTIVDAKNVYYDPYSK